METQPSDLRESIDQFLHHIANQRRVAPNTVAAYHNDLGQFAEWVNSQGSAADESGAEAAGPDSAAVAHFVLHLRDKGYAQATVARKIAAVKSFFHYAAEVGLVSTNPAASLDSPRVRRTVPRAVSLSDVQALLDTGCAGEMPDDLRNRAMLGLQYHSGMRVSEVVSLNCADVDLERSVISCRGRGGRIRVIPLANEARGALQTYLSDGRPFLARVDASVSTDTQAEALFLNHRGARLTRQGFWLIMKDRLRDAGIDTPMTPHSLRHAFALHHLDNGTALRELKELLGHVNISTTQIYTLALPTPASV